MGNYQLGYPLPLILEIKDKLPKQRGRRNWKRSKTKFWLLNLRLLGLNVLWGGWNWAHSEVGWIHWECMTEDGVKCYREIIKWPAKLLIVPQSMSDFQSVTDGSGFPYNESSARRLVAQEVRVEEVALPEQPPNIIPILSCLPESVANWYGEEKNLVCTDEEAWIRMRNLPPKLGVKKEEYDKIINRLLILKMVKLIRRDQVKVINGLQCVTKPNGKQRLIFDGRPANQVLIEPSKVALPDFTMLHEWRVTEEEVVRFGKIDLDNFYHRLGVPTWMVPYLALPAVKASHFNQGEGWVYPACLTLPMGLSHSVLLAQTAHVYILRNSKIGPIINLKVQKETTVWAMVYIDDVILAVKDKEENEAIRSVNQYMENLLEVYQVCGLIVNKDKLMYASEVIEGLGCVFSNSNKGITPKEAKIKKVIGATKFLLYQEVVSPKAVEKILGHWIWFILLRRSLYAIFFHIYRWLHNTGEEEPRKLWISVRRELFNIIVFADLCTLTWKRASSPRMLAMDASLKGAGACELYAPQQLEAELREGDLDIQTWGTWSTKLNQRWKRTEHINVLEMRAMIWTMLKCLQERQQYHKRWTVFSDSRVVVGAVRKGRSSSYMLCCLLRRLASLGTRTAKSTEHRLILGLANSTIRSYAGAIAKFLEEVETIEVNNLDAQLVQYIQLFPPLAQRPNIEKIGCAFRHFFPDLAANLPRLNRYAHQLRRQHKGITKPPMIWDVVILVIRQLVSGGFPTTALGVWLQFDCFLRPAELCGLQTHHIAFPGGCLLGSQARYTLILLPKAKTGPLQSVRVKSSRVADLLENLVKKAPKEAFLFPTYSVYRQRLGKALTTLGLGYIGYTPHSIRHGAATMELINEGEAALPSIMFRGRWESSAGKSYLQMGAAALIYAELPETVINQAKQQKDSLPNVFRYATLIPKV